MRDISRSDSDPIRAVVAKAVNVDGFELARDGTQPMTECDNHQTGAYWYIGRGEMDVRPVKS